ncbi:MAG: DUF4340 domain-containing protein [Ruminococcaceae bacterium]|nr:DUF4340 domain-containing protein [Oscillospiraceae bacterium]
MKKLSKFQKQIIAIGAVAVLAVALFAAYLIGKPDEKPAVEETPKQVQLNYSFTEGEKTALEGFKGTASFTFKSEKGKGNEKTAPLMALAEDYAALNQGISVSYGKGDADAVLTVNGTEVSLNTEKDIKYYTNLDGVTYAFNARSLINTALFGKDLGVDEKQPFAGFDKDGDILNKGGNINMFSMGTKYTDLKFVQVTNEHGEITFYSEPKTGTPCIMGTEAMMVDSSAAITLMSFAQNPVATGKVENPEELSVYGLDSDENATATILVAIDEDNFRSIRIGKALPDGSGYYALCDDASNKLKPYVYTTNAYASFALMATEDFLSAEYGVKLNELTDVYSAIDNMCITMDGMEIKLKKLSDGEKKELPINYTWKVTDPDRYIHSNKGYALSNFYNVGDMFNALSALKSDDIKVAVPTEEDLAEYGLAQPYRSYTWTVYDVVTCRVYMSRPDTDSNFYLYGVIDYYDEKTDSTYTETLGIGMLPTSAFRNEDQVCYMDFTPLNFIDNKLFTDYVKAVDKISITKDGETHIFRFEKNAEGDITAATLDNGRTDLQSVRRFYVDIIHPVIIGEHEGEVPDGVDLSITLTRGDDETTIDYTRLNSVQVYATVNGQGGYYINYDDLAPILESYQILLDGGIVPR